MTRSIEEEIDDLIIQATKERSHYYVKSILVKCKALLKEKHLEKQDLENELWKRDGAIERLTTALKEAELEIGTLRDCRAIDIKVFYEQQSKIASLESENARLRELLKPFAEEAELCHGNSAKFTQPFCGKCGDDWPCRFEKAKEALSGKSCEHDTPGAWIRYDSGACGYHVSKTLSKECPHCKPSGRQG